MKKKSHSICWKFNLIGWFAYYFARARLLLLKWSSLSVNIMNLTTLMMILMYQRKWEIWLKNISKISLHYEKEEEEEEAGWLVYYKSRQLLQKWWEDRCISCVVLYEQSFLFGSTCAFWETCFCKTLPGKKEGKWRLLL